MWKILLLFGLLNFVISCTDAQTSLDSLGLKFLSFKTLQNGSETSQLRTHAQTREVKFDIDCSYQHSKLKISWDQGETWQDFTELPKGQKICSIDQIITPPESQAWPVIEGLVKTEGSKGESEPVAVTFLAPSYRTETLYTQINGGDSLTNLATVTLQLSALMEAGSYRDLLPSEVYITSTAGCNSGGAWYPFGSIITGYILPQLNRQNYIYVKFRDNGGNESPCLGDEIIHDNTPPVATSLTINGGLLQVTSLNVALSIAAEGDVLEMKVNNSENCNGPGTWEAYNPSKAWTLAGPGLNSVSVVFRDAAGNLSECLHQRALFDTSRPDIPTSLTLKNGINPRDHINPVTIRVSPVKPGNTVKIYSDKDCTPENKVGQSFGGYGNYAEISVNLAADGLSQFWAQTTNPYDATSECSQNSASYFLDTEAPQVINVTSSTPAGNYVAGALIDISVSFSQSVYVTGSDLSLSLSINGLPRTATYTSGSSTNTLHFSYIVRPDDLTNLLDYSSSSALNLGTSQIKDDAGNDAELTLPVPSTTGSLSSNRTIAMNYSVQLALAEGLNLVDNQNPFQIQVTGVMTGFTAKIYTDSTCTTQIAQAISTGGGKALVSVPLPSDGTRTFYAQVYDSLNEPSSCSTASVTYTLDTVSPGVTNITTTAPDGNYTSGSTISIAATFATPVTVSGTGLALLLNLNGVSISAPYASGSGTDTLYFTYTVQPGDLTNRLDYVSSAALIRGNSIIKNTANNNAVLTLPAPGAEGSLGANKNISINYSQSMALGEGVLARDRQSPFIVKVSGVMNGWDALVYSDAGCSSLVGQAQAGGGNSVDVPVTLEADGSYQLRYQLRSPSNVTSSCSTATLPYTLDTTGPVVTNVTSSNPDGEYTTGQNINIQVTFDEPVFVTDPDLKLRLNLNGTDADVDASYQSGAGSNTLNFIYIAQSNHSTNDLDYKNNIALLGGAEIKDALGNVSIKTLPNPAAPNSLGFNKNLKVNFTVSVLSVIPPPATTYYTGQTLEFIVRWSGPVTVIGTPTLRFQMTSPGTLVSANYSASRSSSTESRFIYTVASGNNGLSGVTLSSISSGTINNSYSSAAVRTIPSTFISNPSIKPHGITAPSLNLGEQITEVTENAFTGSFTLPYSTIAQENISILLRPVPVSNNVSTTDYSVPSSQTITTGTSSASLNFNVFDNNQLTGLKVFTIQASAVSAGGLSAPGASRIIALHDDEFTETIQSFASGSSHICALYTTGKVWCTGSNASGQLGGTTSGTNPVGKPLSSGAAKIYAAGDYSCALMNDGTARCWGVNSYGQLGNGTTTNSPTPVTVSGLTNVQEMFLSEENACATYKDVLNDTYLKCWGNNGLRSTGTGGTLSRVLTPTVVLNSDGTTPLKSVTAVATSYYASCAIAENSLYCWGYVPQSFFSGTNNSSTTYNTAQAMTLPAGLIFDQLISNGSTICGLQQTSSTEGKVYCWGSDSYGLLGDGGSSVSTYAVSNTPIAGTYKPNSLYASKGTNELCAHSALDNKIYCWGGYNYAPVISLNTNVTAYSRSASLHCYTDTSSLLRCLNIPTAMMNSFFLPPGQLTPRSMFQGAPIKFAAGYLGCYLQSNGEAYCLNSGTSYGTVGNNFNQFLSSPSRVTVNTTDITTNGISLACAIDREKILRCWGGSGSPNDYIYVGDGTTNLVYQPTFVSSNVKSVKISPVTTSTTACALKYDNSLWCWGDNSSGQLGLGTAAGTAFTTPKLIYPSGVQDFALGSGFMCAIVNSKILCAGQNSSGQLGDATGNQSSTTVETLDIYNTGNPLQLEAGYSHICARYDDFSMRCWGLNSSGQLGRGNTTMATLPYKVPNISVKQISLGLYHTCAINTNNELRCWGSGSSGQLGNGSTSNVISVPSSPLFFNTTSVWATWYSTCAATTSGQFYCWGTNDGLATHRFSSANIALPIPGIQR